MNVTEFLEKWGRTVFEKPLAQNAPLESPRELAEIRFAVLEEVRRNSYRAGARMVFPFDLVRVTMRGVEESRAAVFSSAFFRSYLIPCAFPNSCASMWRSLPACRNPTRRG